MNRTSDRTHREILGTFELPSGQGAREVIVEYDDGICRREIELVVNGRYQKGFVKADDDE